MEILGVSPTWRRCLISSEAWGKKSCRLMCFLFKAVSLQYLPFYLPTVFDYFWVIWAALSAFELSSLINLTLLQFTRFKYI